MKFASSEFWRGRRVLVTGHTGFKGSWLCLRLMALGAKVSGYALDPPTAPSLFELVSLGRLVEDRRGDIRDQARFRDALVASQPQVVFHLAAQALVRAGLEQPLDTLDVNVMGAARVLEALRGCEPDAIVVVTSDKVYRNAGDGRVFAEADALGGGDPYSGSKAAAELVTRIYRESFGLPVVSARAGNVVGGGDFAADRLLPDVWRAFQAGEPLAMRRPQSTRPWSHVLDVIEGYLLYAEAVGEGRQGLPETLNFGPAAGAAALSAIETARLFAEAMRRPLDWRQHPDPYPEKATLAINSSLARTTLGWSERFPGGKAIAAAGQWYAAWEQAGDARILSERLAAEYGSLEAVR